MGRRASIFGVAAMLVVMHAPVGTVATAEELMFVSPESLAPVTKGSATVRGRSFVPLHSTVIAGAGRTRLNFSGSLSIHNTSARHVLVIDAIEYRDAAGQLLQNYVPQPIGLRPFASVQIAIAQEDTRGGVGPSFVVDWSLPEASDEPAIEAVMIASQGTQGYSFVSPARRLIRP
jgi:hypothetical protein